MPNFGIFGAFSDSHSKKQTEPQNSVDFWRVGGSESGGCTTMGTRLSVAHTYVHACCSDAEPLSISAQHGHHHLVMAHLKQIEWIGRPNVNLICETGTVA